MHKPWSLAVRVRRQMCRLDNWNVTVLKSIESWQLWLWGCNLCMIFLTTVTFSSLLAYLHVCVCTLADLELQNTAAPHHTSQPMDTLIHTQQQETQHQNAGSTAAAANKVCSLWSPYVIGQTIIFLPCSFFLLFPSIFFFFPRLISAVGDWMSTILLHMAWS